MLISIFYGSDHFWPSKNAGLSSVGRIGLQDASHTVGKPLMKNIAWQHSCSRCYTEIVMLQVYVVQKNMQLMGFQTWCFKHAKKQICGFFLGLKDNESVHQLEHGSWRFKVTLLTSQFFGSGNPLRSRLMRLESWSHPEWLTMGARGGRSYPDANWIGLDDRNSHRRNSDHGILYNIYIYI